MEGPAEKQNHTTAHKPDSTHSLHHLPRLLPEGAGQGAVPGRPLSIYSRNKQEGGQNRPQFLF